MYLAVLRGLKQLTGGRWEARKGRVAGEGKERVEVRRRKQGRGREGKVNEGRGREMKGRAEKEKGEMEREKLNKGKEKGKKREISECRR